jgi:hypothetical protein
VNQFIENKVQFGITIPQGWRGGDLPLQQENDPVKQYEFSKSISIAADNIGYPSPQWFTEIGPIEPYVLADLYAWLEAHSGLSHSYVTPASGNVTSFSRDTGSNSSSESRGKGPFRSRTKLLTPTSVAASLNSTIEGSSITITTLNWPEYSINLSSPVSVFVPIAGVIGGVIAWFLKR